MIRHINGVHLELDRFAHGMIRRKAKALIGRAGFTQQDFQDLEQELALRLVQGWRSYNPKKAHPRVFITTVIERAAASILRNKRARKRYCQGATSLHAPTGSDNSSLADTISDREYDRRRGRHARGPEKLAQLKSDIADVLLGLPANLRDLAQLLKTESLSAIARKMGVPRTTLGDQVRRLRLIFEQAGLKNYR